MDKDAVNTLKQRLQSCFGDKTVLIVGSGLSCAEGIPGMRELSQFLCENIPNIPLTNDDLLLWEQISIKLQGSMDLENTLLSSPISPILEENIIRLTSELMLKHEQVVLEDCIINQRNLKIERLLPHLSVDSPKVIHIITTNYDRLIEFAGESLEFGIDTMMVGKFSGRHDPIESFNSLPKKLSERNRRKILIHKNRIHLYKPHGSLDWYSTPNGVLSSSLNVNFPRMIITPGTQKYLRGYEAPFDVHRDRGNQKIDEATSIIFVGYGFNDQHLQTHISPKLMKGTKGIILTRSLSDSARDIINKSPNLTALSHSEESGISGTLITTNNSSEFISGVEWWDIEKFVEGVLSA